MTSVYLVWNVGEEKCCTIEASLCVISPPFNRDSGFINNSSSVNTFDNLSSRSETNDSELKLRKFHLRISLPNNVYRVKLGYECGIDTLWTTTSKTSRFHRYICLCLSSVVVHMDTQTYYSLINSVVITLYKFNINSLMAKYKKNPLRSESMKRYVWETNVCLAGYIKSAWVHCLYVCTSFSQCGRWMSDKECDSF